MAKLLTIERFCRKIKKDPVTGCWLWTASTDRDGYGLFQLGPRDKRRAPRVAYEFFIGPIPEGQQVLHTCDVPACVNPDHFFLGVDLDNVTDKMEKGRWANQWTVQRKVA